MGAVTTLLAGIVHTYGGNLDVTLFPQRLRQTWPVVLCARLEMCGTDAAYAGTFTPRKGAMDQSYVVCATRVRAPPYCDALGTHSTINPPRIPYCMLLPHAPTPRYLPYARRRHSTIPPHP
eukprot:2926360-Rhodomonas_salina.1